MRKARVTDAFASINEPHRGKAKVTATIVAVTKRKRGDYNWDVRLMWLLIQTDDGVSNP